MASGVTLVHIAVENQYLAHLAAAQQVMTDHRQVIENAEPGRMVIMSMVGTAGQVAGQAMFERLFGRQQRAAYRAHGAPCQGFTPRQPQAALVFTG